MSKFKHLRLLLWKNYILQIRHPKTTLAELFVPCVFVAFMAIVRLKVGVTKNVDISTYKSFNTSYIPFLMFGRFIEFPKRFIMYSPNDTEVSDFMTSALKLIPKSDKYELVSFQTEDQMLEFYKKQENYAQNLILCGIVFKNPNNWAKELKYKLRFSSRTKFAANSGSIGPIRQWYTRSTFPFYSSTGPRMPEYGEGGTPGYFEEGFVAIQHMIAMNFAQTRSSPNLTYDDIKVVMQRFPYPPYIEDRFLLALQFIFPIILILSFIYPAVNLCKSLVIEKEKRLKESMKMMGLKVWMHWLAWFIKSFLFFSISSALLSILLKIRFTEGVGILNYSNIFVIYLFFICYSISCITFSFLLSTFFSKANVAAVGAGVVFFLSFVPYFAVLPRYGQMTYFEKLENCLSCNTGLAFGAILMSRWEGIGAGIQWSNLAEPPSPDDSLALSDILMMFLFDSVLYLALTLYIEAAFPGDYGVPQKWYFPFTHNYWYGNKQMSKENLIDTNGNNGNEFFEREPTALEPGIKIMNLSKTFDGNKYVVKSLNLRAYKGQITALLGHNGAGKTTTMSILTGLFPPSSGKAIVNGFDIRKDIEEVRSSLGICPQFDVLFDDLTVEEHLNFFCQLKNFDKTKIKAEVNDTIKDLGLEDKKHKASYTLSGGQKRKLSVGIALVGKSEIVILDEPTSGMDVYARRFTWDLLISQKSNRTILLSTHFMEEADILSERIAIMSNGQIQCCGSPLFLKRKYGIGYHMTIVKTSDLTNVEPITQLIQTHIKEAKVEASAGAEVTYILPYEKSKSFENLFTQIESKKDTIGIDSYGVSITTMEEVFLRVGDYADKGMEALKTNSKEKQVSIEMIEKRNERNTGLSYLIQQLSGLVMKRVLYSWRNIPLTLSQLLLPMIFAIIILVIIMSWPKMSNFPYELALNTMNFMGADIPYYIEKNADSRVQQIADDYKSQFFSVDNASEYSFKTTNLTQSMIDHTLKEMGKGITYFNSHEPIGAMICDNQYQHCGLNSSDSNSNETDLVLTGLFNNQPFHSIGMSLAAVDLALIRYLTGKANYSLKVSNHPLPGTTSDLLGIAEIAQIRFHICFNLLFSMSFLGASFVVFPVREDSIKMKHLQKIAGVKLYLFWLSSFIWDYLIYIMASILLIIVYIVLGEEPLQSLANEFRIFIILATYGLTSLPYTYLMSFMFDMPSTAYVTICLSTIIVGIGTFIVVMITELPVLDLLFFGQTFDWIFSILVPIYNLSRSIYLIYNNYIGNKFCNNDLILKTCEKNEINVKEFIEELNENFPELREILKPILDMGDALNFTQPAPIPDVIKPCCKDKCEDMCFPWNTNFFGLEKPGIGSYLIILLIQCFIFWSLIVLIEQNIRHIRTFLITIKLFFTNLCRKKIRKKQSKRAIDSDVELEAKRIDESDLKTLFTTNALIIRKLTKYYGDFCAVDHISYGIKRGECFGLLGMNGAGKTTTFKMITGDENISSGDVYVNGYNIKEDMARAQKQTGYCPQFEGLLDQLTGRETLQLFCRLRGIKEPDIDGHIVYLSKLLYFDMHINQLIKNYSGGTKRKLSTAVALLGEPSVSFLDEPTTGVDPVARRCLWDALTKKLREGQSIVLTSHSMEECEALCNRLIIMVNGKIACIGSPQHLKNKFGKGYIVHIKLLTTGTQLEANIKQVEQFMNNSFKNTKVKEIHYNSLNFEINNTSISWAQIFGAIEREKENLEIEDYSVGQTSLEQIFLSFAEKQKSETNIE